MRKPPLNVRGARNDYRSQGGYTTVELVVSMTIFAIVLVTAIGTFVTVAGASAKTGAQRKVQQNARYSIEELTRVTRASKIDHEFYGANTTDPRCSLAAHNMLALVTTQDGTPPTTHRIYYFRQDKKLYKYELAGTTPEVPPAPPSCSQVVGRLPSSDPVQPVPIIAGNVEVLGITFLVGPNGNPVPLNNDYTATASANSAFNVHPRVTIVLTVQTLNADTATTRQAVLKASKITLETTVSSRAYPLDKLYGKSQGP